MSTFIDRYKCSGVKYKVLSKMYQIAKKVVHKSVESTLKVVWKSARRIITEEIYKWKNSTGKKKALVIKGMRQIGKTFIVQAFANENYEEALYYDLIDALEMYNGG